jgi:hypothetical protein
MLVRMGKRPDGTPGKKPPAPSVSARPDGLTLILRKMREHARVRGYDPRYAPHEWSENDVVVIDGETCVGRIYKDIIHVEPKWRWFLQTVPAPLPNRGMADTLEDAKASFKKRHQQVKGVK